MSRWIKAGMMVGAVLGVLVVLPPETLSEPSLTGVTGGGSCFAQENLLDKEYGGTLDYGSLSCSGMPRNC